MAYHPTPLLSWGDPPPSYPHHLATTVADAVRFIDWGESVHVPDEETATRVLLDVFRGSKLGWQAVCQRIHLARSGELLPEEVFDRPPYAEAEPLTSDGLYARARARQDEARRARAHHPRSREAGPTRCYLCTATTWETNSLCERHQPPQADQPGGAP